ncbi:MAG: Peptidase S8 and S53 subtilisin kexin sedolisin [Parcubacteria group bacterium Gr01-1014_20]|nr:MAG: Peptidase S8 and S53 subtilisin kexin sedolisin [Parcubacteria group bacterium Gr01-1014_20]
MRTFFRFLFFGLLAIFILPGFVSALNVPYSKSDPYSIKKQPIDGSTKVVSPTFSPTALNLDGLRLQIEELKKKVSDLSMLVSLQESAVPPKSASVRALGLPKEREIVGYTIKLKDPSVSEYKVRREKEVAVSQSANLFSVQQSLKQEVKNYRSAVLSKHKSFLPTLSKSVSRVKVIREFKDVFNGFSVNVLSAEDIKKIEKMPEVEAVYPEYVFYGALMDSVPLIKADLSWGLDANGASCATSGQPCLNGQGARIGVIDSGIDYTHPDFGSCTTPQILAGTCPKIGGGWDFVNNDADPMDDHYHGTHVAGIAAADGVLRGVAPSSTIYVYKVLNSQNLGYIPNVIAAIERSVDPNQDGDFADHLDVINLSLGGLHSPNSPTSVAADNAVALGVVVVASAGNYGNGDVDSGENAVTSPADAVKVIAVGAAYKINYPSSSFFYDYDINPVQDQILAISSRGPAYYKTGSQADGIVLKPDLVAPGAFICSARWDSVEPWISNPDLQPCFDTLHFQNGATSMATPHVAGLAALLKQAHPAWSSERIVYAIKNGTHNVGHPIFTGGWGRIDALDSLTKDFSLFAKLEVPTSSYSYGIVSGLTDIQGRVEGPDFASYSLDYIKSTDYQTNNWIPIHSSNVLPPTELLFSGWDTSGLVNDGYYILRLTVTDMQGNSGRDMVALKVKGTPKVDLYAGFSPNPTSTNRELQVISGQAVYFRAFSTSPGSLPGTCSGCTYQWYEDGVLQAASGTDYSTSIVSPGQYDKEVKVITTYAGLTTQRKASLLNQITKVVSGYDNQQSPAIWGDKVVYEDWSNGVRRIYLYNLLSGTTTEVASHPIYGTVLPAVYEDLVVWEDHRNDASNGGDIYMKNLSTGVETAISTSLKDQEAPAIYGDYVVWADERWSGSGVPDIYMRKLSTFFETRITTSTAFQRAPDIWGNRIVWEDNRNGNFDIYMYDVSTVAMTRLTTSTANQTNPAIYGDKVVYEDKRDGTNENIYMYDIATGLETRISSGTSKKLRPDIYGSKIVWYLDTTGNDDVYMYDLSTNTESRVTYEGSAQTTPVIYGTRVVWPDARNSDIQGGYALDLYSLDLTGGFRCGDLDNNGVINIIDVVHLIDHAFRGGPEPSPRWIGDLNADGVINIIDVVHLIDHAFRGGPVPDCTADPESTASASVSLSSGTTSADGLISVPLSVNTNAPLIGLQINFSFDLNKLEFVGVEKNSQFQDFEVQTGVQGGGAKVGIYDQEGGVRVPSGSTGVVNLKFRPKVSGVDASTVKILGAVSLDEKILRVPTGFPTKTSPTSPKLPPKLPIGQPLSSSLIESIGAQLEGVARQLQSLLRIVQP